MLPKAIGDSDWQITSPMRRVADLPESSKRQQGDLSTGPGHLRMPFTAANEPAALPQINILTEYDSNSTVATKRQVPGHSNKRPPS